MGPGPRPEWGTVQRDMLTMASPTTMKTSVLAQSRDPSEKWLLSRPMTRP